MSIWTALYMGALVLGLLCVFRNGDRADKAQAISVVVLGCIWIAASKSGHLNPVAVVGTAAALHAITILILSVRVSGIIIGVTSCLITILAGAALLGWIPSEMGQGMSHNFWHYATSAAYAYVLTFGGYAVAGGTIRRRTY